MNISPRTKSNSRRHRTILFEGRGNSNLEHSTKGVTFERPGCGEKFKGDLCENSARVSHVHILGKGETWTTAGLGQMEEKTQGTEFSRIGNVSSLDSRHNLPEPPRCYVVFLFLPRSSNVMSDPSRIRQCMNVKHN